MKKLVWLLLIFALTSLACHALMPVSSSERPPALGQRSISGQATRASAIPTQFIVPTATLSPLPTPIPITCTDDDCLNTCLERIESAIPRREYEPVTGAYAENEVNLNLVYYDVRNGRLGEPQFLHVPDAFKVYQQDTTSHQALWNYASSLLPQDQLQWINGFEIFSATNYSGWVSPSGPVQGDRSHWTLGMELAYAQNPLDLTYTLVHEYGHMITLNTDQIAASDYFYGWYQNPAVCKQFLSPDGCSKPDSYINQFYQRFWTGIYDAWLEDVDRPVVNSSEEFRALVKQFYDKHPEMFIRDYAATNISEDMAESFMLFVLWPRPTGDSIPEQKVLFFYDYPELVSLRQQMIQGICSYTGK